MVGASWVLGGPCSPFGPRLGAQWPSWLPSSAVECTCSVTWGFCGGGETSVTSEWVVSLAQAAWVCHQGALLGPGVHLAPLHPARLGKLWSA